MVNSPERLDLTKRCLYIGSIDWVTPVILEIVAVGAIAIVLLLRMPYFLIDSRTGVQSMLMLRSISTGRPRSFSSSLHGVDRQKPRSHLEPL